MQNNIIETVLGAVVIAVAIIFLVFAYKITDLAPVEGYRLKAKFANIEGLDIGDVVKISGIKVGKITNFELEAETYEAVVTLNVEDDIKLSTDTAAVIASAGLMGGKFLSLEPGADDIFLEDGDLIEYTQSTPGLEQLLGQAIFNMNKSKDSDEEEK